MTRRTLSSGQRRRLVQEFKAAGGAALEVVVGGHAATQVEAEMKETLFGIYGGKSIACWLTGLKHYMVRRGLFTTSASFLGYPLTDECQVTIDRYLATR